MSLGTSLYALRRVGKVDRATKDLDWLDVANLVQDVQKLKRNATKYVANVNAAEKLTKREKMEMAILQHHQQALPKNVTRIGEEH